MVNQEKLEECIDEAMKNGDMELLDILLKLRDTPTLNNNDTENVELKNKTVQDVNIKAIANYFSK